MYGQSAECGKSICLHLENFIAFQIVIQELRTVCDDGKRSALADEMLHSGSLEIRGGTPAQEMSLGKRQIPEGIIYLLYVLP